MSERYARVERRIGEELEENSRYYVIYPSEYERVILAVFDFTDSNMLNDFLSGMSLEDANNAVEGINSAITLSKKGYSLEMLRLSAKEQEREDRRRRKV